MNSQIKQIAERLKGLREAFDLSAADTAAKCNINPLEYEAYESGQIDIPISFLCQVAQVFSIEPAALLSGSEPHMESYFVTRKGKGISVERVKDYRYQSLAMGFRNAKADPFIVTVEPKPKNTPIHLNTHPTQEFNLVLEGRLLIQIDEKELILEEGDSIYFDAKNPHGMKALDGKAVKFLAVII